VECEHVDLLKKSDSQVKNKGNKMK